ncbi:uncharacterized protein [Apostichopus japonicus]|uniref:uncharacterized protein n=1 Tax=Stichopus japonicus TaxID=307972 RepID=UPI003AB33AD5
MDANETLESLDLTEFFDWEEFETLSETKDDTNSETVFSVCKCKLPSTENLFKCNHETCQTIWFHTTCMLKARLVDCAQKTLEEWICPSCKETSSQTSERTGIESGPSHEATSGPTTNLRMQYPAKTFRKADASVLAMDFFEAAINNIFEDDLFKLKTPLTSSVVQLARRVMPHTKDEKFGKFAAETVEQLWSITKNIRGTTFSDKVKSEMWHDFHKYRSMDKTLRRWQKVLNEVDIEREAEEVFFLQHALEKMFSSLLATLLESDMPATTLDVTPEAMTQTEDQALRYCAGYVPYKLIKKYNKMQSNEVAAQYVKILSKWCQDESPAADSFLAYSNEWIEIQTRGGLFLVNDSVFIFFKCMEEIVRTTVQTKNIVSLQDVNLQDLLIKKMEGNQQLLSTWSAVCDILSQEASSLLRCEVIKCFIKMRCESFMKVYININKQITDKISQKSDKGLRKSLGM